MTEGISNGETSNEVTSNGPLKKASNESEEEDPSLLRNLTEGFDYLCARRERSNKDAAVGAVVAPPDSVLPSFLRHVTVNFVDPSSSSISTSGDSPVHLYEKFMTIFDRDYASTLNYVPYQLFRNSASGVIETLPIKASLSKGGVILPDDISSAAVHDYSWERPYCHVYLAACESLEHYRTKVKPSIQAFVSQLESAVKTIRQNSFRRHDSPSTLVGSSPGDSSHGASSTSAGPSSSTTPKSPPKRNKQQVAVAHTLMPRYVVVYVPTGDRSSKTEDGNSGNNVPRKGLASRLAAARQRMRGPSDAEPDTATAAGENGTNNNNADDSNSNVDTIKISNVNTTSSSSPSIQKLNKMEREIARRFAHDFPNGNICTLSSLAVGEDDDDEEEQHKASKLEWNSVLKAMGSAITNGFLDRCHRFDDELRKLDMQRRGDAANTKPDEEVSEGFHLTNFFLVKECLAFTYEQMRLPAEALLQYEELRAFLPEPDSIPGSDQIDDEFLQVALTGRVLEFRGLLRSNGEFANMASVVEEYLLAREIGLLFQMQRSVRIAKRCLSYVEEKFNVATSFMDASSNDGPDSVVERQLELQKWAFDFCWNVRKASDRYMKSDAGERSTVITAFARTLCDLLEFARLRLVDLGDTFVPDNLLKAPRGDLVATLKHPWSPWEEPTDVQHAKAKELDFSIDFLKDALSSKENFILRYMDLTKALMDCNDLCGRQRLAARFGIERMELCDASGDKAGAAREILDIVSTFDKDKWSGPQFALLFRLASFQREISPPSMYLQTLVQSFSATISDVAPPKALDALQTDLERIVENPEVQGSNFFTAPLFGPVFGLEGIATRLGSDRNLVKRLYTVGDTVGVTVSLYSFLPKEVRIDRIAVNLVAFRAYVAAMEDNLSVKDEDTCRVLAIDNPSALKSGQNQYRFDWLPKSSGQFIISSLVMSWCGVEFKYTAKELRRPTIRVDIVPCETTQTLDVCPKYLIPGHEQNVTFDFNAGTDVVQKGTLQLVGSPGVLFIPPDSDTGSWVSSFEVPLPPCPPSENVSLEARVKVLLPEESSAPFQPAQAKVQTAYKYANEEPGEPRSDLMHTSLEAKIPVMGKPALSVLASELLVYSHDKAMVNVVLRCNAPTPFKVKKWSLELPHNLALSNVGDLNASLADESIASGDRISLSFDCAFQGAADASLAKEPALVVDLENDLGVLFQESTKLNVAWPSGSKSDSPAIAPIPVTVTASSESALLGIPIQLIYAIDKSQICSLPATVSYYVDFNDLEWVVSGKIEGVIESENGSLEEVKVIALPVRSGRIDAYPTLCLACENGSDSFPLQVELKAPPPFSSLAPPGHTAVAFPIGGTPKKYHFSP